MLITAHNTRLPHVPYGKLTQNNEKFPKLHKLINIHLFPIDVSLPEEHLGIGYQTFYTVHSIKISFVTQ